MVTLWLHRLYLSFCLPLLTLGKKKASERERGLAKARASSISSRLLASPSIQHITSLSPRVCLRLRGTNVERTSDAPTQRWTDQGPEPGGG